MKPLRIFRWLTVAAVAMVNIIFALLAYEFFWADPPMTYNNLPFPVQVGVVRPGEIVPLTVSRCNNTEEPLVYSMSHSLVNLETRERFILSGLSAQDIFLTPGCRVATSFAHRTPPDLTDGMYEIYGTARITGRTRDHLLIWHSVPFKVEAAP